MAKAKSPDPFVCNEPEDIGLTTTRILKQRMKTIWFLPKRLASESSNGFQNPLLHSPLSAYRLDENRKVIEILHLWHGSRGSPQF
jgi:hypothetical protein